MYNRLFVLVLVAIKPPGLRKVRSVITLSVNTHQSDTPLSQMVSQHCNRSAGPKVMAATV